MQRIVTLICYHLGLWGLLGFLATLVIGFIACCAGVSKPVFYILLGIFAIIGIACSARCILRNCKSE